MPVVSIFAEDDPDFTKAVTAYQEKKFDAAIKGFKKVAGRIFGHEPSFYNLGLAYFHAAKYADSLKSFRQAAEYNPYNLTTAKFIANLCILTKDYPQASEKLNELISRNPQDAEALSKLRLIEIAQKDSHAAISINLSAIEELSSAKLAEFEQSEVSKRLASRLLDEKKEAAKKSGAAVDAKTTAAAKKRPFGLTGELNQTVENYNRNPATSNPINDVNTVTNLKLEGKVKDISTKVELESYYNRWNHTELDYFKVNLKDNKNDEVDIGKFSAKNFPDLVSHPTIEQGVRWWHSWQFTQRPSAFKALLLDFTTEVPPSLGELYRRDYFTHQLFKTWEITALRGRSKKPINIDRPKLKNDRTFETSGQFEQWVNAVHIMTKPTSITELGFSYSRVKDDEKSATVSTTTYPLETEAVSVDGKIDFLDGKLKTDGEYAWSNYDDNLYSEVKNKHDIASVFGLNFKYIPNWELSYDLKRIGTNFKVEGAYQTQDKITHTFVTKYSAPKTISWRIRSIDVKYEPAHTNLPESGTTTRTYYKTFQPKISFNLPQEAKLSFDYKRYFEDNSCKCTYYRTNTFKTDLEYECKPIKTTFKPSYTFERKDDRVSSPTDEKQKDYALTIENTSVTNLTLKSTVERDKKNYIGATTKAYDNKKYSFEAEYAFIPNRFTSTFKASMDDKEQSDTNNIQLDTLDCTFTFTSKDGNRKLVLEYERKLNIYEPWTESSAYRQNYAKAKYTQKF